MKRVEKICKMTKNDMQIVKFLNEAGGKKQKIMRKWEDTTVKEERRRKRN